MVPPSPTAQPRSASMNHTPLSLWRVGLCCGAQVRPPSVLAAMRPEVPTAQKCRASPKATPRNASVGPAVRTNVQVPPPSAVVAMTSPLREEPTRVPAVGLMNRASLKDAVVFAPTMEGGRGRS